MDLHLVTAALRQDSADVAIYAAVLLSSLEEILPGDCVVVRRARLSKKIKRLAVRLGDWLLTLTPADGRPVAEICHEVHGVTLSRRTVSLDAWIEKLSGLLVERARVDAQAAEALRRMVQ
ncbi:hypothetical protein ACIBH1_01335 [Nonomuraea sp. NPDC050663]|uniref:hypothetical protein n=1 Tax=Nonomuraea sp. NPDC050663 TaxID=3364370 RepID=UPI0037B67339